MHSWEKGAAPEFPLARSAATMHFAYPPRKSSDPRPFAPARARLPLLRRSRLRTLALMGLAFVTLCFLIFGRRWGSASGHVPSGNPPVVIVTMFDSGAHPKEYITKLKENRKAYAAKHGTCTIRSVWHRANSVLFGQRANTSTRFLFRTQATRPSLPNAATITSRARQPRGARSRRSGTP